MAKSINEIRLLGNLGKDAETTALQSGSAVTKFSVATTRSWRDKQTNEWKEETTWHNVVAWGATDYVLAGLIKGAQVHVSGRLSNRSYEKDGQKQYITEVVADDVIVLGRKGEGEGAHAANGAAKAPAAAPTGRTPFTPAPAAAAGKPPVKAPAGNVVIDDGDVPF